MNRIFANAPVVVALTLSLTGLSSCGQSLVKNLQFVAQDEGGSFVAGFDTVVSIGSGALPDAKLPIYDPKAPANFLGYVETHANGQISLRVNLSQATKLKYANDAFLPNGRELPIVLPTGVHPIAIPVINSNSKVYVAVGQKNIMAGLAVTLVADTAKSSDWMNVLKSFASNIFYPFNISPVVKGTAGLFMGEKIGVSVFAVKSGDVNVTPSIANVPLQNPDFSRRGLAVVSSNFRTAMQGAPVGISSVPEVFEVKTQHPTGSKMRKIQRALDKVRKTKID